VHFSFVVQDLEEHLNGTLFQAPKNIEKSSIFIICTSASKLSTIQPKQSEIPRRQPNP